jgi:hypothetical protein
MTPVIRTFETLLLAFGVEPRKAPKRRQQGIAHFPDPGESMHVAGNVRFDVPQVFGKHCRHLRFIGP